MGLESQVYLYPDGFPEEALVPRLFPDKLSLSGGTEISRRTIPGFARQVTAPRGRKSVDEKVSMLFADVYAPRAGQEEPTAGSVQEALEWILRHLGPGEEGTPWGDDDDNVFVLRTRVKPQKVLVETWTADLQAMRQSVEDGGNVVIRMRLDLNCVQYHVFTVDDGALRALASLRKPVRKVKSRAAKEKPAVSKELNKKLAAAAKAVVQSLIPPTDSTWRGFGVSAQSDGSTNPATTGKVWRGFGR